MSSEQCPFCAIVAGDDPDVREVYRNEHVVAFFPTEPAVLGHVLVVPRRHVEDIWGLRPEESAELSAAVLFLSAALRSALLPEGLNVIQSNGDRIRRRGKSPALRIGQRPSGPVDAT